MLGTCNWFDENESRRWFGTAQQEMTPMQVTNLAAITGLTANQRHPFPALPIEGREVTSTSTTMTQSPTPAGCIRPERLSIDQSDPSSLVVQESRFGGCVTETDVINELDGERRTFVHRSSSVELKQGDRVSLRLIAFFIGLFLFSGCNDSSIPKLPVQSEEYWTMPADGKRIPAPRGMTVTSDGEYLVLDNAGRLLVFDDKGSLQRQWWMPDHSVGRPEGVCLLKDNRIVVADTHYHRVVLFDRDGNVEGMFGQFGTGPGEFVYPVHVIQDEDENLYVSEYGNYNDRIQKFRPDGTFVQQIGAYGTDDGQFQRPSGMALHQDHLYVVDAFNNRIQVFEKTGQLLAILGLKDKISEVHYPYDISITKQGKIFVVEYSGGCVTEFDLTGKLIGRYGTTGNQAGQFQTPWGLATDDRGRVYVCDTGNRRIVKLNMNH